MKHMAQAGLTSAAFLNRVMVLSVHFDFRFLNFNGVLLRECATECWQPFFEEDTAKSASL